MSLRRVMSDEEFTDERRIEAVGRKRVYELLNVPPKNTDWVKVLKTELAITLYDTRTWAELAEEGVTLENAMYEKGKDYTLFCLYLEFRKKGVTYDPIMEVLLDAADLGVGGVWMSSDRILIVRHLICE